MFAHFLRGGMIGRDRRSLPDGTVSKAVARICFAIILYVSVVSLRQLPQVSRSWLSVPLQPQETWVQLSYREIIVESSGHTSHATFETLPRTFCMLGTVAVIHPNSTPYAKLLSGVPLLGFVGAIRRNSALRSSPK